MENLIKSRSVIVDMASIDYTKLSSKDLIALAEQKKMEEIANDFEVKQEFEKEGDLLIDSIVDEHIKLNETLKTFKDLKSEAVLNYNKKAYEINGKEYKESKSFKITHSSGKRKVMMEMKDKLDFNSEAIVHINTIKDLISEKFSGLEEGLYDFVDSILVKNKEGDYDPNLLAKAKRKAAKLKSPQLMQEFDKLENCRITVGVSRYIRAYEKDENGKFQDISLNYSSL